MPTLHFEHLNLFTNPFGELSLRQRKAAAVIDSRRLDYDLYKPATAIQFVGDHGRGKSTHLLALHERYPECPYQQLHSGNKIVARQTKCHFVDSIENLCQRDRLRFYSHATSVALTTHTDLSRELRRAGYTVFTQRVASVTDETLLKIFNQRIIMARRNQDALPLLTLSHMKQLMSLYSDDIRAMEHHLYDCYQQLEDINHVEV